MKTIYRFLLVALAMGGIVLPSLSQTHDAHPGTPPEALWIDEAVLGARKAG